jgi:hypothetical protein
VGNDQLKALYQSREQIAGEIADWQQRKELIDGRLPHWQQLTALLTHAADLPIAAELEGEVHAICQHRRLLDNPDPVPALVNRLTGVLRATLNETHTACTTAHEAGLINLEASAAWQTLSPERRYDTLSRCSVREVPKIAVGSTEEILDTLHRTKLCELQNLCDALPTRFSNALAAAAKLLEPKAQPVNLPSATIKDDGDLRSWLTEAEERIRKKLKDGPVIVQ